MFPVCSFSYLFSAYIIKTSFCTSFLLCFCYASGPLHHSLPHHLNYTGPVINVSEFSGSNHVFDCLLQVRISFLTPYFQTLCFFHESLLLHTIHSYTKQLLKLQSDKFVLGLPCDWLLLISCRQNKYNQSLWLFVVFLFYLYWSCKWRYTQIFIFLRTLHT